MKIEKLSISKVLVNPDNPRIIKDYKFSKLVKSIREFPQMLEIRPIVVNDKNVILGGNMRYKASIEAGLKEIYVVRANNLTEEQQKEFIVKDNVGFGEWDWDMLANDWDTELLNDWGLDIWKTTEANELEDFFEESKQEEEQETKDELKTLELVFTPQEYERLQAKIKEDGRAPETIFLTALDL